MVKPDFQLFIQISKKGSEIMKNQNKKLSREEKEMLALMKKLRKNMPKMTENAEHRRDLDAEKDYDIRTIEADRLFKEMKRRDF